MSLKHLQSEEELNAFVQEPGKKLLFKHSTTCPISANAYKEFQSFTASKDIPAALVKVIEDRPVSNKITEIFGIKHESPQIFLLENDRVEWNASHWNITKDAIEKAVGQ
ncbi:bacillithiol system redox-active protein YtxJ [Heyndrickxia acidicola]|uniref:Bacillithiol system redox-active protein YtxJ n=1 Tax=Heyndrickxia acidicola TaxID=209389 RepID=A0ABU6MLG3_9BACI|nr:bacillithiol system redox-active protein YtxJ [Heyndrickxia acidicola]MED1205527.1 bacillithiol system redox-active protein YtxJ [Heyndrickxia acidicola]